ncbi:putative glucose-1-phosphate adenylyltransferase, GlgD subunit [[Eubacterium] cylindroides ATCC 27803]|uniref:Putative glucose-1-phosphate adenylyltransferase, GlgD subunit n=2 Tax=Faecalitalea cylindroides TaxID=39483 RepID=U2PPN4_9FIRM|nr:putative glucose-1-phosphate adenylyltransferase, GlgD subunit [[Eubacterium] cylindroides ATCC 27803] [Faecalitalea cylindroides ATCC 27803]
MSKHMCNALGIITYNGLNVYVQGLQEYRPIAGFNFLGRYRLVDFPISNMTNSGIDEIQVFIKGNPRPMIEHIGDGRQYNINSKHGSLDLIPYYNEEGRGNPEFAPDVESYYNNINQIEDNTNDYVIIAPVNMIYTANYKDLLNQHIESGAEISILYQNVDDAKDKYINCDVLQMNRQKGVLKIEQNLGNYKTRALSLQTYILSKELFIQLVKEARKVSSMYWFKDIVNDHCVDMDIRAINYRGNVYCINDLRSYFESNLALLEESQMKQFSKDSWPIYTRTSDTAPAIYLKGGSASGSFIANGCQISGSVKNSIIGRGSVIGKGAKIENCVIMSDVVIGEDAVLKNVIIDKHSKVLKKKELIGNAEDPLYIGRRENV